MNPYPAGRWTSRSAKTCRPPNFNCERVTSLRPVPLRDLWWMIGESELVADGGTGSAGPLLTAPTAEPGRPDPSHIPIDGQCG